MGTENEKPIKLLTIGMDKDLLDKGSVSSERHKKYAEKLQEIHAIVFARKEYGKERVEIANNAWAYPTGSKHIVGLFLDAYRIGKRVIGSEKKGWVISAQDPFESGLVGYLLARATSTPFQIQEHGDFFGQSYWRKESFTNQLRFIIGRWLIQQADSVRVVSERIKEAVTELGVPESRISVAPVHTDVRAFETATEDKELLELKNDGSLLILTMARFVPQKNLPLLIRAFTKALQKGMKAKLVIIGKGPLEKELHAVAKEAPEGSVLFKSWTDNPAHAMKSADMYALSSNYEGWGRVCIEALASGVPILMTNVGCAGEVVIDGETGLVVDTEDEWAFTEGLYKLATDKALCERLIQNGREIAESQPTLEESAKLYIESVEKTMK
jgi:glycosyltransferase involved in cell wall biosynthesis